MIQSCANSAVQLVAVGDPCQAALKIVGGALQASLAWAETSAMSAQLQELQHEIVSPKQSHSGSCAIQFGLTWMLPAGAE